MKINSKHQKKVKDDEYVFINSRYPKYLIWEKIRYYLADADPTQQKTASPNAM